MASEGGVSAGPVDMLGATKGAWTVVERAPNKNGMAVWRLRHKDGRERLSLGVILRVNGFRALDGRRGKPYHGNTGARRKRLCPGRQEGPTVVVGARRGLVRLRLGCGHEVDETQARAGARLHLAKTKPEFSRCRACYLAAIPRYGPQCAFCDRPRDRRSRECDACNKAAERNGRHDCCDAPIRLTEKQHSCRGASGARGDTPAGPTPSQSSDTTRTQQRVSR